VPIGRYPFDKIEVGFVGLASNPRTAVFTSVVVGIINKEQYRSKADRTRKKPHCGFFLLSNCLDPCLLEIFDNVVFCEPDTAPDFDERYDAIGLQPPHCLRGYFQQFCNVADG